MPLIAIPPFPPDITQFPMCMLCCILGLCLGGGGPAAALMAALLSVGSSLPATITALLGSFQLPTAALSLNLGLTLQLPPLVSVCPCLPVFAVFAV